MSRLWSFILAVVVVLGVFAPNRAWARAPAEAETRVGGIDLVVPVVVGLGASSSADLYQGAGAFTCEDAVGATLAAEGGAIRVASGGGPSASATLVREIQHGESVASIIDEAARLTYESGGLEHAVISTQSGQRLLLQGGPGGMTFEGFAVRRVLGHTHPVPTGPSGTDFGMLQQTGQRSSWIYELFGGGLTRFRRP